MATVILLRHARSTANGAGVLAGRTPGVGLHDIGIGQATELVSRLSDVPLAEVITSPLQRCHDTLRPLVSERGIEPVIEPRLAEVDYGAWTGRTLGDLAKEDLWSVVQQQPSAAVFPEGEGLAQVQARSVAAIREHDRRITAEHGSDAVWLACSHGDVIKAILADALGTHLDGFQRIVVDPASLSVVRYTALRPFVIRVNDNNGDLSALLPAEKADKQVGDETDAVIGGSTGP
ncbi:histidine phosphatase family protein [Actinoalloteichus hymeniacidonis]|uniref:Phosphomutase n=1 Tax=Actinoalloteichus hymeniacidonis TaxID=340345 RepID=A0AAC9HSI2_9PSEU|nr:histidine phosphatase family protein [Actinoalloteichus hymeniacidonis]AOS63665.1 putative phosphomutase [Actinoalloteichus hymeniacidonis]MBB5908286.1 putative phosphomutase (TIGR03848 family) [Actinoalloteichus hymeniacidonis]